MSLISASGIIGGTKEYLYRGVQQLPIVLGTTSLIFTITTGSIAHANLALGMGILMPIYTFIMQTALGFILNKVAPMQRVSWTRSTGDTCNLIPSPGGKPTITAYKSDNSGGESVPSYWLMSLAFFIGYSIMNALDNLMTPAQPSSDQAGVEKRNTQSVFVIVSTCVFSLLILAVRFGLMRSCEGRGTLGIGLSLLSAAVAGYIGVQVYILSKKCGARSSDLFGILSQIIPAGSSTPNPIVCSSD